MVFVTLILSMMCRDFAIQVSDRRLSYQGTTRDDESNKATVLITDDARLLVGYTGLAEYGSFKTNDWLSQTLLECAAPDYAAGLVTERFVDSATRYFKGPALSAVPARAKRLTVMFTGFLAENPPRAVALLVTNFQDWNTGRDSAEAWPVFRSLRFTERPDDALAMTWIQRIGAWQALTQDDEIALRELLKEGRPPQALVGKAVETIREAAARPASGGTIGKQLSSLILPSDFSADVGWNYHSETATKSIHGVGMVFASARGAFATKGVQFTALSDDAPPIAGPKLGRNQPCWCRSGTKFKFCHGR